MATSLPKGVQKRGPYQFRVQVRHKGRYITRTFDKLSDAVEWQAIQRGKVVGDEYVDKKVAKNTTLEQACDWFIENIDRTKPDAKNKASKAAYWKSTGFADWALVSLRPADLLRWRREILDEDNGDDESNHGPDAEVGPQTVVHRLNALSQIYKKWSLNHDQVISNPVIEGIRPSLPKGRDRRVNNDEEKKLLKFAAKSSRPWLTAAIIISVETAMRQGELAGLIWNRVHLRSQNPYCELPKTKNDRARRVPLSVRAVAAFTSILPEGKYSDFGDQNVFSVESGRGIAHAFRDVITDSAFPNLRWHDFRHEAISRLFELTDLRDSEIMSISGHLRPEMLLRYTHLRADKLGPRLPGGKANINSKALILEK